MSAINTGNANRRPVHLPRTHERAAGLAIAGQALRRTIAVALGLFSLNRHSVERTNAVLAMSDPEAIRRVLSTDRRLEDLRWRQLPQTHGSILR
jgi:hypothetical protein